MCKIFAFFEKPAHFAIAVFMVNFQCLILLEIFSKLELVVLHPSYYKTIEAAVTPILSVMFVDMHNISQVSGIFIMNHNAFALTRMYFLLSFLTSHKHFHKT